jgi:WD40 repeat protein/serine/threonine protein kinase
LPQARSSDSPVCLTEAQIEAVASGALADERWRAHAETCATCRAAAARIQEINAFIAQHRHMLVRATHEADAPPTLPADAIPGYRLLDQLHRGGQGVVYKALQESTKQLVAVKILRSGAFAGAGERVRFQREVSVLARLNHPGIVAIHDSGAARDQHYLVTHLIHGKPLDEWIVDSTTAPIAAAGEEPRPPPHRRDRLGARTATDQVFRLFAEVCDAVQAAHMRGVIHRDLKPGNIIVDADGHPHVLDFGLAKLAAADESPAESFVTRSGNFLGSLPWASPEQATGSQVDVDVRTDVYAIGVMLYRALTGRFPYDVSGPIHQVLERILQAEPPRPSGVCRGLNREIDTIVLKALSKDRERRYQSAAALRDDLTRYVRGEPIAARGDSNWYVLRKTAARHKAPLAVVTMVIVLVGAFALDRSRRARTLERALHVANVERGRGEGRAGNLMLAERLLWREHLQDTRNAPEAANHDRTRAPDTYWALWELYARQPCLSTWNAGGAPQVLAFTRDGRDLLVANDDGVQSWKLGDTPAPELRLVMETPALRNACRAISPHNRLLATGASDGTISIWDAQDGRSLHRWSAHEGKVHQVLFHPDSESVISCGEDQAIRVWRLPQGTLSKAVTVEGAVDQLAVNPGATLLAAALPDEDAIVVYSLPNWRPLHRIDVAEFTADHQRSEKIRRLAFSPDGTALAAACFRYACVWQLDGSPKLVAQHWHEMLVNTLEFGPGGDWLASAGTNTIRFWDTQTHQPLHTYSGHSGAVAGLRVDPVTRRLASSGDGGDLRLWEPRPFPHVRLIRRQDAHCVQFSPDGTRLAHCGESPSNTDNVVVIDAHTGATTGRFPAQSNITSAVAFCGDSGTLAVGAYDSGEILLWDLADATIRSRLTVGNGVASLASDRDGRLLAVGDNHRGKVTVWDVSAAESQRAIEVAALDVGPARVPVLTFASDGARLFCGAHDGRVVIFETTAWRRQRVLTASPGTAIRAMCLSRDDRRLATAGDDGIVRIWNVRSGRLDRELSGHRGAIYALSFGPNRAELVSGGHDGQLRLWNADTGRGMATLATSAGVISTVAFSPDGEQLVYGAFGDNMGVVDLTHYDPHIEGNRAIQQSRLDRQ